MDHNIDKILQEAREFTAETREEIENFRIKYLGKKGILTDLFSILNWFHPNKKRSLVRKLTSLKSLFQKG